MNVAQSCPTLCDPMDYTSSWNSPGQDTGVGNCSLVQGIFLAKVSRSAGGCFNSWATREPHVHSLYNLGKKSTFSLESRNRWLILKFIWNSDGIFCIVILCWQLDCWKIFKSFSWSKCQPLVHHTKQLLGFVIWSTCILSKEN